ncbi:MAG: hypothetical protein J7521_10825 [Caulobacter sp.]|nr:hypothetical protein [Caulobacter sp.]
MSDDYQVTGQVAAADFTLKIHRGEGMALLAMNWRQGQPPRDFVGFGIEYRSPGSNRFVALKNRLTFTQPALLASADARPATYSTLLAPIQKFRWAHFPYDADKPGAFRYRVTPIFMDAAGALRQGVAQTADIVLARDTYPGALNVSFTRGFVSSQAFVDRYGGAAAVPTLVPDSGKAGLSFVPTHPDAKAALAWMGFEARREIVALLKAAVDDPTCTVRLVAYDLNLPDLVELLKKKGARARVIIDDSGEHHGDGAAEDAAADALAAAGVQVRRQHMGNLQHNKTLVVDGAVQKALLGSTNFSWRGFFVQSNNALIVSGAKAVAVCGEAFEAYWAAAGPNPPNFQDSPSAEWRSLGLDEVDAQVAFSPHKASNSVLKSIADDIRTARSSIFYSLAFLSQTPGVIREALFAQTNRADLFVAGISDKPTGVEVAPGSTNRPPAFVSALEGDPPAPFRPEPNGLARGVGTRMHHKFVVVDFDKPGARVYLGSYNMSVAADGKNGENLVLIRDRRVATSYMIEAVRMIDHYQFRAARNRARERGGAMRLRPAPATAADQPWWAEDYADPAKIRDRLMFA